MSEAFAWIGHIIESLGRLIPRLILVRATHAAVKWKYGKNAIALAPGLHVYFPLVSEVDQIVCARQTDNLPTQVLMTADRQQIVVGTLIVYRINDPVLAIGCRNWDVASTIRDITMAAVVEVIRQNTLDELADTAIEEKLTGVTRKRLRQFGVSVHRVAITDFSTCRLIGEHDER